MSTFRMGAKLHPLTQHISIYKPLCQTLSTFMMKLLRCFELFDTTGDFDVLVTNILKAFGLTEHVRKPH